MFILRSLHLLRVICKYNFKLRHAPSLMINTLYLTLSVEHYSTISVIG